MRVDHDDFGTFRCQEGLVGRAQSTLHVLGRPIGGIEHKRAILAQRFKHTVARQERGRLTDDDDMRRAVASQYIHRDIDTRTLGHQYI